jgi:hypothetical protein
MARVKSFTDGQEAADVLTAVTVLPAHVSGDLLIVFASKDDGAGGTISITVATGWTQGEVRQVGTTGNNSIQSGWWYKVAGSSSETAPVLTSTDADSWAWCVVNVEGAGAFNTLANASDIAGAPYTAPSVTTTVDNCLILQAMASDGAVQPTPYPSVYLISAKDNAANGLGVGWFFQKTAGATGTKDWYGTGTADDSAMFTVSIADGSSGAMIPAYPQPACATFVRSLTAATQITSDAVSASAVGYNLLGDNRAVSAAYQYTAAGGTYVDYTTQANDATDANVIPFPASEAIGDAFIIQAAALFSAVRFDLLGCTRGVAGVLALEYTNDGTNWKLLTYKSDATSSITVAVADNLILAFLPPSDWTTATVNGTTGYTIRLRVTTVYTTNPTISQIFVGRYGVGFDGLAVVADTGINPFEATLGATPAQVGNIFAGSTFDFGSTIDLTTGYLLSSYIFGNPRDYYDIGDKSLGGVPFGLLDASNNTKLWTVGAFADKDTYGDKRNTFAVQLGQSTDTSFYVSPTAPTLSATKKMLIAANALNGAPVVNYYQLLQIPTAGIILSGGSSTYPVTFQSIKDALNHYPLPMFRDGQCFVPVTFGGQDRIILDASLFSIEFPKLRKDDALYTKFHLDSDILGVKLDGRVGDTIKLRSCLISSDSSWKFEIASTASSSATWDLSGLAVVNATVTLRNVMTFASVSFSGCSKIDATGLTMNSCSFSNPRAGLAAALKMSTTTTLSGCSFSTGTATDSAIEIGTAGTYQLSNCSFAGFTHSINVTATTGTVTISHNMGSNPTYKTAGATVSIVGPVLAITAPGVIDGSRVRVYNLTTATEISNLVISGGAGYSKTITTEASTNDIIEIYVTYQSGVTAKEPIKQTGVFSSGGLQFLVSQVNDAVYVAYAIDGSAVTEYSSDYPNVQIDMTDLDDQWYAARLYAWWMYNLISADGIRNFFGAFTAVDAGNIRINTSVVDMYLDNLRANTAQQKDNINLYRDDGALPVINPTTGGGGLSFFSGGKILTISVGSGLSSTEHDVLMYLDSMTEDSSGRRYKAKALEQAPSGSGSSPEVIAAAVWDEVLTGHTDADSAGLALSGASAPSAATVASAVRTELATELARVDVNISSRNATTPPTVTQIRTEMDSNSTKLDVAVSTRLATSGYTAPDNASVTAIKAKTDNLPSDPADQSLVDAAIAAVKEDTDKIDAVKANTDLIPALL